MKNTMSDLQNHLFAQLERLSEEDLSPEDIEKEAAPAELREVLLATAKLEHAAREARKPRHTTKGDAP